jgi:hypothetical protein
MRTRVWITIAAFIVGAVAFAGVTMYRIRMVGYEDVRVVTERVAAAMVVGDRAALAADPALSGHQGTVEFLVARRGFLTAGYRVSVQCNGDDGYHIMSDDLVSHVGKIETPTGRIIFLGFWRNSTTGVLTFVTAAD